MNIAEFYKQDPRRRSSDELAFGTEWKADGHKAGWNVFWVRDTGELAAMRTGWIWEGGPGLVADLVASVAQAGTGPGVTVLLVERDEEACCDA